MSAQQITDVEQAAAALRAGQLVAFPTETVYGLGGLALSEQAVAKIFAAKNRPTFDPLIVHVPDQAALDKVARDVPEEAQRLMDRFWPGPLTLVLPKMDCVPDLVTAGLPTVAVRAPRHPVAEALLRSVGAPVAAPSANPFGRISPTTAAHVFEHLGERIEWILDGGPCPIGVESTIVEFGAEGPRLLRHGGVAVEELEEVLGSIEVNDTLTVANDAPQAAPGMQARHYAPTRRLRIFTNVADFSGREGIGVLSLRGLPRDCRARAVEVLSPAGDLTQAAARFFAALRRLDALDVSEIWAEQFPAVGLGRALNDRLRRAAHPPETE